MSENIFLVIGLGAFGMQTCEELSARGAQVIAVDNRPEHIDRIKDKVSQAFLLDTTQENHLSNIPLENIDIAIVAIGDNTEANILTTALLKQAGVPYIIARASTEIHSRVLKQIGANEVLDLEKNAGRQLAEKVLAPDILDSVPVTMDISIAEVYLPATFTGLRVEDVDLPGKMNLSICAIKREKIDINETGSPEKKEIVVEPDEKIVLSQNDVLIVIGRNEDIDKLKEI